MANPALTNRGSPVTLIHSAPRERWGSPQARISQMSVPGVDGMFVSQFGKGSRMIQGGGFIYYEGASTSASLTGLLAGLRTLQALINATPNTYTSIDGSTHGDCILVQYAQASGIQYENGIGIVTARMAVRYALLQQVAG